MSIRKYASEDWVQEKLNELDGGVTSWNDLTDKPFYDTNEVFFEWDGDISGITEIITASNGNLYRIADAVPSEKLIGATMRIISDGNERIKVLEEGNISYVTDDFALLYDLMVICYSDNMTVSYGNSTFTVGKAGIYHVDPNSHGVYYAASIKHEGELKKLDPKYLPEIDMSDYETKEDAQAKLEAAAGYTHSNIYYKKMMIDRKDKAINKKISNISKTITEQNIDTAFNDIFGGE